MLENALEIGRNILFAAATATHPVTPSEVINSQTPCVEYTTPDRELTLTCGGPYRLQVESRSENQTVVLISANVPRGQRFSPRAWANAIAHGLDDGEKEINSRGCEQVGTSQTDDISRERRIAYSNLQTCFPELYNLGQ